MKIKQLQKSWDTYGEDNPMWAVLTTDTNWNKQEFFATGQKEIDAVFKYLDTQKMKVNGGRALDFGSGAGRLSRALSKRFKEVVGVDIAPSMVRTATELNQDRPNVRFIQNSDPDLGQLDSGSFDFIYSNITLQHIEPRYSKEYIKEFVRLLAPDGVLLFQIPAELQAEYRGLRPTVRRMREFGIGTVLKERFGKVRMEMHGVPRDTVVGILEGGGMTVDDIRPDSDAGQGWTSFRYLATKPTK